MTITIYKYPVPVTDRVTLQLPEGAKILSVQSPWDDPQMLQLWALVDPDAPGEQRELVIVGTGNPVPQIKEDEGYLNHLATVVTLNGRLVWHVFEDVRYEPDQT